MVEVELATATVDDLAAVLELRREIAAWLATRDVAMWQTPIRRELVTAWIDQQALWVCREGDRIDRIVGTIVLLERDPDFWGDDGTPARYVHLLMVDRAHAGQNLGGRILRCAEKLAQAGGARFLRLDAATDIEPLQRWYEERGYVAVGSRTFDVGGQRLEVTLRQKDLAEAPDAGRGDEPVLQQVTYLQMPDPSQLQPAETVEGLELRRVDDALAEAAILRELHDRIACAHHWSSLQWSDERWRTWLQGEGQRHWFIEEAGRRIGWASLQAHAEGDVEIDNFGLVPEALGRGRGGAALTLLTREAWAFADELHGQQPDETRGRVFLHTSSWDHRAALANYRARGFQPYSHTARLRWVPRDPADPRTGA